MKLLEKIKKLFCKKKMVNLWDISTPYIHVEPLDLPEDEDNERTLPFRGWCPQAEESLDIEKYTKNLPKDYDPLS